MSRGSRAGRAGRSGGGDRGAVTAELAMALPMLVAVTIGLVWLLGVGAAQVRVVDAARETARAVARGDLEADAVARGAEIAPPGSRIDVNRADGTVHVEAVGRVSGPGGLFGFLPAVTVRAESVAADEDVTS